MSLFLLGDEVEWSSQAQGAWKTKTGVIAEIVQPGERPNRERFPDLYTNAGAGFGRKTVSYVVAVRKPKSVKHYWPVASRLFMPSPFTE